MHKKYKTTKKCSQMHKKHKNPKKYKNIKANISQNVKVIKSNVIEATEDITKVKYHYRT